jgi:hypothetical protein
VRFRYEQNDFLGVKGVSKEDLESNSSAYQDTKSYRHRHTLDCEKAKDHPNGMCDTGDAHDGSGLFHGPFGRHKSRTPRKSFDQDGSTAAKGMSEVDTHC